MQRTCLRITSAIVTGLGVFAVGDEAAAQTILKGAYGFTGTGNCLVAPGSSPNPPVPGNTTPNPNAGFGPSLQPNSGPPKPHCSVSRSRSREFGRSMATAPEQSRARRSALRLPILIRTRVPITLPSTSPMSSTLMAVGPPTWFQEPTRAPS